MRKNYFLILLFIAGLILAATGDTWLSEPPRDQIATEGADDQLGMGRLFVPVMSVPEWEPYMKIYNSGAGTVTDDENPGKSIFLKPGKYTLLFGSSEDPLDLVQKHFTIYEHQTTLIEPDWSGLIVNVINENMEYVRFGYEIMHLGTGISVGSRYSREESSFDDMNTTWILPPGKYKLVKQGEPYNTIVNFSTFEIKPSELTEIVVVINDLQQFIGSGELGLLENFGDSKKAWYDKLNLKGSVSFYSDNEDGEGENSTDIISQAKIDNRIIYDAKPYYLNFRQSLNEEFSKLEGTDGLRVSSDQLTLSNTGIYYFTDVFGVYSELILETNIFPDYKYDIPETDSVTVTYRDGSQDIKTGINKFKESDPLSPVNLNENIGLNFTFIKSSNSNLFLRTGFGFRQDFNENVFSELGTNEFTELDDLYSKGIVITAGADFNFAGNITYTSTANLFYNLDEDRNYNIEWENDVIFKLFRYMSIDYNFSLNYDHIADSPFNYWVYNHRLALEFSYYINR